MKTSTKVLIGAGAVGVGGFILWRLYAMGKDASEENFMTPDTGWGGYDTTTNDGNGATFGPKPSTYESMPTEEYARPQPLSVTASRKTTPAGPDYTPAGKGALVAGALGMPRPTIGHEANKPMTTAQQMDPCAGIVCPVNHTCVPYAGSYKCIDIQ